MKCGKCKQDKPESEFFWKNKAAKKRHTVCKECMKIYRNKHYAENKQYYIEKSKELKKKYKKEVYEFLISYCKENPCVDCGEDDFLALDFDHIDRNDKVMNISKMVRAQFSLTKIKEEISKCEVRCANCHRKRTAQQLGWYKVLDRGVAERLGSSLQNC